MSELIQQLEIEEQIEATEIAANGVADVTQPALTLRRGQQVFAHDRHAGQVGLVSPGRQGKAARFVLRRDPSRAPDVIVPIDWVREADQDNVYLTIEHQALRDLPELVPDAELAAEVSHALENDTFLRQCEPDLGVAAREGIVILSGHVMTSGNRARIGQVARRVPGVLEIENRLVPDDELVTAVATRLAGEACAHGQIIFVQARHGIVILGGELGSAAERATIEECAAGVPQVRGIINWIRAPGVVMGDEEQRVLQPRIGQEVYAVDMPVGRVERVVISPRNRRVTTIIVKGAFPDTEYHQSAHRWGGISRQARQVVVPIGAVTHVNKGGVLLRVRGIDVAHCDDFEPEYFAQPEAGWQLPYPYHLGDVLLDPASHTFNLAEQAKAEGRHNLAGVLAVLQAIK